MKSLALWFTAAAILTVTVAMPAFAQFGIQSGIGISTKFELLGQSAEELLNSGYAIVSNGGQGSLILRNEKKWVFCLLDTTSDPRSRKTISVCAALN